MKTGTKISFTKGIPLDSRMQPAGAAYTCAENYPCYGEVVGIAKRRGEVIGYIVKAEHGEYAQVERADMKEVF